jgi:hypothetical protein
MRGSGFAQVNTADKAKAHAVTRKVFESPPRVPDVYQNRENHELQRRHYQRTRQLQVSAG